jgi:hypothetical protein
LSPPDPAPPGFDPARALDAVLPAMRAARNTGLALVALAAVVAVVGTRVWLTAKDPDSVPEQLAGLAAILAVVAITVIVQRTRQRHAALILPAVAATIGLTHRGPDPAFLDGLPDGLLPYGRRRRAEDVLSGHIAGRAIRLAEVRIERGGKNSSTLFRGVVAEVATSAPLPDLYIAPISSGWGLFTAGGPMETADRVQVGTFAVHRDDYGIWADRPVPPDDPGLVAVTRLMADLRGTVSPHLMLYRGTTGHGRVTVAARTTTDLFRIGGLLATRASLLDDLQAAAQDLTLPVRLVAAVLQAEADAVSRPPGGSGPRSGAGAGHSGG